MSVPATPNSYWRNQESPVSSLIEHARYACQMHRLSFEGTDPRSVRVPAGAVDELVQSLTGTGLRRVQQIVPFTPDSHHRRTFSGMVWEQLARQCPVERYYLVPSGEENQRLADERVEQDQRSQLTSKRVLVMGCSGSSQMQVPMSALWLIDGRDGRVVVREEIDGGGATSWLVSGHDAEVTQAQRWLEELTQVYQKQHGRAEQQPIGPDLTHWMLESAQMLYTLAPMSCTRKNYIDESGRCEWYHRIWQYLRLFDMVSSPSWHPDFYATELREQIRNGARRILISGTADYTTLAYVFHAARDDSGKVPRDLQVHVLDLCQTPLLACQWYARKLELEIAIHQADITDARALRAAGLLRPNEPFDLIVADAFLTRFPYEDAQKVVRNWSHLLRRADKGPGGKVLTTVRLHPRNDYRVHEPAGLATSDRYRVTDPTDDFELRLRERATTWRGMLSIDLDDLFRLGRRYAERMKSHDLGDIKEIAKLFEDREYFDDVQHVAELVPGELVGTEYLRITASRS